MRAPEFRSQRNGFPSQDVFALGGPREKSRPKVAWQGPVPDAQRQTGPCPIKCPRKIIMNLLSEMRTFGDAED